MALIITNPKNLNFAVNELINYKFIAKGGIKPYKFKTTSTLPAGLNLNLKGILKGTVTNETTFSLRLKAISSNGRSVVKVFNITIAAAVPTTTTTTPQPLSGFEAWNKDGQIGIYQGNITSDLPNFSAGNIAGLLYDLTSNTYGITFTSTSMYPNYVYSVNGLQAGNSITLPNMWEGQGGFGDVSGTYYVTEILYNFTPYAGGTAYGEYAVLSATPMNICINGFLVGGLYTEQPYHSINDGSVFARSDFNHFIFSTGNIPYVEWWIGGSGSGTDTSHAAYKSSDASTSLRVPPLTGWIIIDNIVYNTIPTITYGTC